MPRWLKLVLWVAGVVVVLAGAGYWWFIGDSRPPANVGAFALDMEAVRKLGSQAASQHPVDVRVEVIGVGSFPRTAVVGGGDWGGFPLSMASYQLVFPGGQTVIIDTALDENAGKAFGLAFDTAAYTRMNTAMTVAAEILLTHEHTDHIGGILSHPDQAAIVSHLALTAEQLAAAGRYAGFAVPPGALAAAEPLAYEGMHIIAPGVVLIEAPGHTPGSQMIYAVTASGREYLFVGDIAWSDRNIEEVVGRPRLVSQFLVGNEDRDAVFAQLAALNALQAAEPELTIVPGHDAVAIERLISEGRMVAGFVVP